MFGLDALDMALIANGLVVLLLVILGGGLTVAVLGALLAPLIATLAANRAYQGRHAYNDTQAVCDGIRKAGRSYRLANDRWMEVTA